MTQRRKTKECSLVMFMQRVNIDYFLLWQHESAQFQIYHRKVILFYIHDMRTYQLINHDTARTGREA
jgi:hypothetical protein